MTRKSLKVAALLAATSICYGMYKRALRRYSDVPPGRRCEVKNQSIYFSWKTPRRRHKRMNTNNQMPTVIFIPSTHLGCSSWFHAQRQLAKFGIPSITFDRCGHGLSSYGNNSQGVSLMDEVETYDEMLFILGVREPYIICGHMDASIIALQMAMRNKHRLQQLILVEPTLSLSLSLQEPNYLLKITQSAGVAVNDALLFTGVIDIIHSLGQIFQNFRLEYPDKIHTPNTLQHQQLQNPTAASGYTSMSVSPELTFKDNRHQISASIQSGAKQDRNLFESAFSAYNTFCTPQDQQLIRRDIYQHMIPHNYLALRPIVSNCDSKVAILQQREIMAQFESYMDDIESQMQVPIRLFNSGVQTPSWSGILCNNALPDELLSLADTQVDEDCFPLSMCWSSVLIKYLVDSCIES
ncbi:hypothetical protein MIR68_007402 [Amoeboaphelidium protococcarum]|nr:hypothetical protein MIR68_007402 [Amoeboaphelidium protococcarum]